MRRARCLFALLLALGVAVLGADYVSVTYTVARPDGTIPASVPGATLSVTWQANPDPAYLTGPQTPAYSAATGVLTWSVPEDCQVRVVVPNTPLSAGVTYSVGTAAVDLNTAVPAAPEPEPSWSELLVPYAGATGDVDIGWYDLVGRTLALRSTVAPVVSAGTVAAEGAGPLTGAYSWGVTYVTATGESAMGYGGAGWTATLAGESARLSGIPTGSSEVTARRIYRTLAGSPYPYYLVGTLADNTTTTYLDAVADGALGAVINVAGTTGGGIHLNGLPLVLATPDLISIGPGHGTAPQVEGNIWIGQNIAPGVTTAHQTTVVGSGGAGGHITTAAGDSYFGSGAGANHVSGNRNAWGGLNAFWSNVSGAYNTGWGAWTGFQNLGWGNTFLGYEAGYSTIGDSNLAITVSDALGNVYPMISGNGAGNTLTFHRPSYFSVGSFSTITATSISTTSLTVNGVSLPQTIPTFEGGATPGLVPPSGDGTALYLREDGTWGTPSLAPTGAYLNQVQVWPVSQTFNVFAVSTVEVPDGYTAATWSAAGTAVSGSASRWIKAISVIGAVPTGQAVVVIVGHVRYELISGIHFYSHYQDIGDGSWLMDLEGTAAGVATAINAHCPGVYAVASRSTILITRGKGVPTATFSYAGTTVAGTSAPYSLAIGDDIPAVLAGPWVFQGPLTAAGGLLLGAPTSTPLTVGIATVDARACSFVRIPASTTARSVAGILGGAPGKILVLTFEDAVTSVADAGAAGWVNLNGTFSSSVGATLVLISDGAQWRELSRSVN
ncbi:MAG: hypothetical protein AB1824_01285 [Acidobacteriota bacterium]